MTSLANRINSYLPSKLGRIVRHGRFYLSEEENDACLKRHLRNYYAYLGKSVFKRPGKDFWRFHSTKMKEFGHPLRLSRLSWAVASYAVDKALNPKQTLESLIKTVAMSKQVGAQTNPR
jgi:hypothetical protein